ncbi:hypothetical protein PG993_012740 [Apiospora rasikravindrae]|uniref:Uncharacterized protein n=1 Tax=Apiospora rasikravindrae TaxID=990691 RepID=A0ABR1RVV3_9PEZI
MTDILGAISARCVRRLGRILDQLGDTLRPDPRAGYSAVRLSNQGLKNSYESVKRCDTAPKRLDRTLEDITFSLNYAYHDGPVRRVVTKLKECKWDTTLSNSVNQLYLAKRASQCVVISSICMRFSLCLEPCCWDT